MTHESCYGCGLRETVYDAPKIWFCRTCQIRLGQIKR